MEIRIRLSSPIDVEAIPEEDANGNIVALTLKPRFFNATEVKPYLFVETVDRDGTIIDKYMVTVSGSSGKSTKRSVAEPVEVEPAYYSGMPADEDFADDAPEDSPEDSTEGDVQ